MMITFIQRNNRQNWIIILVLHQVPSLIFNNIAYLGGV